MSSYRWSASQISTYRDCPRKWFFGSVLKLPRKANAFAALGSYIHKRLEEYLDDGTLPGGSGIAISITKPDGTVKEYTHDQILGIMLPGLVHLPAPGEAQTEIRLDMDLGELGTMIGYVDLVFDEDGIPCIGDHKTTGNFRYAMKEEDLYDDVQCTIYSVYRLESTGAEYIRCRWIYYSTGKPKAKKVQVMRSLTDTAKPWQSILDSVTEMKAIRDSGCEVSEVKYQVDACEKYGGCPFNKNCGLTPMQKMRSMTAMLSLKERMEQRKAAAPAAPAVEAAPAVPVAPAAVNPPEGMSALERLKAKKANPAPAAAPAVAVPVAPAVAVPRPLNTLQPVAQVAAPAAPAVAATPAPAVAVPDATVMQKLGYTLYIDCSPNEETLSYTDVAGPALDAVQEAYGCHYRLIEKLFGGNAAVLQQALQAHLVEAPPVGDIAVSLSSPEVRDVIEVLISGASRVVRGH